MGWGSWYVLCHIAGAVGPELTHARYHWSIIIPVQIGAAGRLAKSFISLKVTNHAKWAEISCPGTRS